MPSITTTKPAATRAISACLVGIPCRWNGKAKEHPEALKKFLDGETLALCPEVLSGMSTPRPACEIIGGDGYGVLDGTATVQDADGNDHTAAFIESAERAVAFLKKNNISSIVLKSGSPTCGAYTIYDGTFSGTTKKGIGVFAALLKRNDITIEAEL